ncbi:MAG: hypothetical protein ACLGIS_10965 [Actinomycetes bacterium]
MPDVTKDRPQFVEVRSGRVHAVKKVMARQRGEEVRFRCGHSVSVGILGAYTAWWVIEHPGPVTCGRCAWIIEQLEQRGQVTP